MDSYRPFIFSVGLIWHSGCTKSSYSLVLAWSCCTSPRDLSCQSCLWAWSPTWACMEDNRSATGRLASDPPGLRYSRAASCIKREHLMDYLTMKILWKTAKQRATCEDLLYICTRVRQAIYWRIRATNFPYSDTTSFADLLPANSHIKFGIVFFF